MQAPEDDGEIEESDVRIKKAIRDMCFRTIRQPPFGRQDSDVSRSFAMKTVLQQVVE